MPKNLVSSSQNEFQRGDGQLTSASSVPLLPIQYPTGAVNQYVWTTDGQGNGSWQAAAGGSPTGTAGGDLSGTYPNPSVALIGGAATSGRYARGNGAAVVLSAIQAADLPAGTASVQGALQLDGTAGDIAALGSQAAGSVGKAADAGHVHPTTGMLAKVADTGESGYTLVNSTGTIISWTAPNDGNLHPFVIYFRLIVQTSQTGGQIFAAIASVSLPHAQNNSGVFAFGGGFGAGDYPLSSRASGTDLKGLLGPGEQVYVSQNTAQSAGAAVLYAQIWGA